jgi:hypothetical protein
MCYISSNRFPAAVFVAHSCRPPGCRNCPDGGRAGLHQARLLSRRPSHSHSSTTPQPIRQHPSAIQHADTAIPHAHGAFHHSPPPTQPQHSTIQPAPWLCGHGTASPASAIRPCIPDSVFFYGQPNVRPIPTFGQQPMTSTIPRNPMPDPGSCPPPPQLAPGRYRSGSGSVRPVHISHTALVRQ